MDLLPSLLLPLAGPEEFDEEDMEKLPPDLQYLEPEKTREPLPAIRANLLEAITQVLSGPSLDIYNHFTNSLPGGRTKLNIITFLCAMEVPVLVATG